MPDPRVARLLRELQTGIRAVLGDDLVGLYLFGSVVYGDFVPGVSDIDLLAATRRSMTEADVDRLRVMHREIVTHHPEWDDRIEVAYLSLHGLKTFRTERCPMGIISPGEPIHLIEAGPEWLMNWFFVLDHGVALTGPPPEMIIAPVSREEFVQSCRENARRLLRDIHAIPDHRHESYAILTVCRALHTHHTGEHVSKPEAARWVRERYPRWNNLIETALTCRVSNEEHAPVDTHADTVDFIETAVSEIDLDATEANV